MTVIDFGDGRVWRKATRSADNGGACVCVTRDDATGAVGIRDSKQGPSGAVQWVAAAPWAEFLDAVKSGVFDLGSEAL